jgi:hypothetical protein
MENADVTSEEKAKLYHLNAERIFHIAPEADAAGAQDRTLVAEQN